MDPLPSTSASTAPWSGDLHRSRAPRALWELEDDVVFLNHGSYGACPKDVLARQSEWRRRMEREPVRFFQRELEADLDAARDALGAFVGARPENLAFVPNATTGVNAVLRSLVLSPGDEIVVTNHGYNACLNAVDHEARRHGARVVCASMPACVDGPDVVLAAVVGALTPRTRLVLIDHVTSPSGMVLPIAALAPLLAERGVDLLVDGAHAPGMLPLALDTLGATYYTGNLHKWVCAPKGAAFLWVDPARRDGLRPHVISHGANATRVDRSRFWLEFDWTGTSDPSPFLCVPAALHFLGARLPGGIGEVMASNRALALAARARLSASCGMQPTAPAEMIGAMAAFVLPGPADPLPPSGVDPLHDGLFRRGIEVPVMRVGGRRVLRISAQLYNVLDEYDALAAALAGERADAEARS